MLSARTAGSSLARRTPAGIWLVGGCPPGSRAGHGAQTHRAGQAAQCAGRQLQGPLGSCWTGSSRPRAGSPPGDQGCEGLGRPRVLASPIPHPAFCGSLSPTSDTTSQASNCLRCCSLPVSIEKAGGEQGGPGSTSPCRVSKPNNCTLCCSSLYSYRPRYNS